MGTSLIRAILFASASAGVATAVAPVAAYAQEATYQIDIPAQPMGDALRALGKATKQNIVFKGSAINGKRSTAVRGRMSASDALEQMLAGSGLKMSRGSGGGLVVMLGNGVGARSVAPTGNEAIDGSSPLSSKATDQEIVVTGTSLRGSRISSPVVTIGRRQIQVAGQNDLGEVTRSLPQNFNGGQNPGVTAGASAGGLANQNVSGGSSFNLRGLGPDATLTLLNGVRMPYDGLFQATDISGIPVAAIERIDVLVDGASAIYGSDAVAGVANIILRRDLEGAEISARYGAATSGGMNQYQLSGAAGTRWTSGGLMVAGDFLDSSDVEAGQRDYLGYLPNQRVKIYPDLKQVSALLSGHQSFGIVRFALDGLYSNRHTHTLNQSFGQLTSDRMESESWHIAPSVEVDVGSEWSVKLTGALSRNNLDQQFRVTNAITGALLSDPKDTYLNKSREISITSQGPLIRLPGGDLRIALGGGFRQNDFSATSSGLPLAKGSSKNAFAFAETYAPLVAPDAMLAGVHNLSLTAAARYERYNRFGNVLTPKLGILWGVTDELELSANWGKSFKTPTLLQQNAIRTVGVLPANIFDPTLPSTNIILLRGGGSRELEPERARNFTTAFTFRSKAIPGLTIKGAYFNIDYRQRIVQSISALINALRDPIFAPFVTRNPTLSAQQAIIADADRFIASVPYNPGNVVAVFDNRYANAVSQKSHGFDAVLTYATKLAGGDINFAANGSWLTSKRKQTSAAPFISASGKAFFPAEFRGRVGASWSDRSITIASYLNHLSGIADTNLIPNVARNGMTTIDLSLGYEAPPSLGGLAIRLSAINLFNKRPPFLTPVVTESVNYDSTNYSALGRTVSVQLTGRF